MVDVRRLVQLALDLWDKSTPSAAAPPPNPPSSDLDKKTTLAHGYKALAAPDLGANGTSQSPAQQPPAKPPAGDVPRPIAPVAPPPPAIPLADTLLPQAFAHPSANRNVLLAGTHIAYLLQRAKRRSIGFVVGEDGLVVRAPRWVTQAGVDEALVEKGDWIVRKLGEMQRRRHNTISAAIRWEDGASLPFMGQPLQLVIDSEQRVARVGAVWRVEQELPGSPSRLYLALPRTAGTAQIRDMVQAWFMKSARQHFAARLAHFAPLLRVQYSSLRLSSAATRWGSAKTDGSIRLNWRLMHYAPAIIDYVVAHELAHLRVMDHSPRFWDTVAEVVPDHRALREQLKTIPAPPWDHAT